MMIWRSRFAVLLLILFGLYFPFQLLMEQIHLLRTGSDPDYISLVEQRFKPLEVDLPARGIMGFVSVYPQESFEAIRNYFVAQFALAPRILVENASLPVVIHDEADRLRVSRENTR